MEDAVFAQAEAAGKTPADRTEAVLSAIFFTLELLASAKGIDPKIIDEEAGNYFANRPRVYVPKTSKELEREEIEKERLAAKAFIAKMQALQRRVQNQQIENETLRREPE